MLDQLTVGLNYCDVMMAVKENRSVMEPLFVARYAARFCPSANTLLDEIIPDFSEDGSNLKVKEIDTFKFFSDLLQDLECDSSGGIHLQIRDSKIVYTRKKTGKIESHLLNWICKSSVTF